jgi:hypothetical protein
MGQLKMDLNLPDHDEKSYYFGIVLGQNTSYHKMTFSNYLRNSNNSIGTIESINGGGFQLGLLANLQVSKHLDIRFYPLYLSFANQTLEIKDTTGNSLLVTPQDELGTITMSFPLQVRFKSDRINNFRFYTLGGIKYDYALNPNKNDDFIIRKSDFSLETGIGFQFFFPYFILSPEFKISYGLNNVYNPDPTIISSANTLQMVNSIDKMSNRMISFSLHFEGGILGRN